MSSRGLGRFVLATTAAGAVGFWEPDVRKVERAALLHDIGKIDPVYRDVLDQAGPLTEEQWELMRAHPDRSVELLSSVRSLDDRVRRSIRHHHERWDGDGYPAGLEGEDIPVGARIIAVADTVDAMLSVRPYREALGPEVVADELRRAAGEQFDPEVVDAALRCGLVRAAVERVREEAEAGDVRGARCGASANRSLSRTARRRIMSEDDVQRVAVADIRMSFGSMVVFMVKWAFATIPALVLIWVIAALLYWGFALVTGGTPGLFT